MKLAPEQLVDWFVTANPQFPPDFRGEWLRMLDSPPDGAKRSDMVAGMKQGINDTLAMLDCRTDSEIERIERALALKGLPSIRKMVAILKKKHQRILARGHIKDDEEFYIVAEVLSGSEFDLSESERAQLAKISYAYEIREK